MFQKSPLRLHCEKSANRRQSSRADRRSNPDQSTGSAIFPAPKVLLSEMEILGTVRFKNDVVIDGRIDGPIDGEIFSDGSVTVGANATVNAEIRGKRVVVEGCVNGNIIASDRLELMGHAEVTGDIEAGILSMQEGAVLVGSSTVGNLPSHHHSQKSDKRSGFLHLVPSHPCEEPDLAHA